MTKITRWSPDTCGCVIEYSWDETLPDNMPRTHTFHAWIVRCPYHAALSGKTLHDTVLEENQRKNFTFALLQNVKSIVTAEDYKWSFDGSRILHVSCALLTTQNKASLQQLVNSRFGIGKVVVE